MSGRFSRTIYVGNLPSDIREGEIEDLFYKVGLDSFRHFYFGYCLDSTLLTFQMAISLINRKH